MIKKTLSPALIQKLKKGNTDAKQVASKQRWEPYYISWAYSIPIDVVKAVMKELSTTRRTVIYDALRQLGYVIDSSTRKR